ncbi:MAG: antibiotic biosynthesis monooxygenase [Desulfobacterales bacterium]|nr:antibiotic biosynthesis monooxygenase [Desulfobacterales bacterium]MCF8077703.1 antibiotic biosynthesis monooxygenase [Desulfobacterales bacterium]
MLTKVLIKRRFRKENEREILHLLNELRAKAMGIPGYVSGITMISAEDPQTMLVIGTWEKLDHWLQWKDSAERKQFEAMLEVYQEQPAEYEVYLVGSPFGE